MARLILQSRFSTLVLKDGSTVLGRLIGTPTTAAIEDNFMLWFGARHAELGTSGAPHNATRGVSIPWTTVVLSLSATQGETMVESQRRAPTTTRSRTMNSAVELPVTMVNTVFSGSSANLQNADDCLPRRKARGPRTVENGN